MYATVTEWETEAPATPESFNEMVALAFKDFKELGATNLRFIKTGENRARTMTLWPNEETAALAIEAIETVANSYPGVRFLGSEKGPLLAEYN